MVDKELLSAISDLMDEKLGTRDKRLESMDKRLESMDKRLESMDKRLESVENDVRLLKLQNETEILPRLQNIEECYVSTFERYKDGIAQMERLQTDMDLVKVVLKEHSRKLEKIS